MLLAGKIVGRDYDQGGVAVWSGERCGSVL